MLESVENPCLRAQLISVKLQAKTELHPESVTTLYLTFLLVSAAVSLASIASLVSLVVDFFFTFLPDNSSGLNSIGLSEFFFSIATSSRISKASPTKIQINLRLKSHTPHKLGTSS